MLLYAFYKSRKLKKKVRMGEKVYIGNRQDGKYHINIKDIYMVLLIVLLMYYFFIMDKVGLIILNAAIIIGTFAFAFIINKIRPERDTNIAIQIVFAIVLVLSIVFFTMMIFMEDGHGSDSGKAEVPLTITDYRDSKDVIEDTSIYEDKNILGSKTSHFVFGEKESIYYNIYKSEYAWILDRIWDEEINGKKFNEK